jgi:hypothetical protein
MRSLTQIMANTVISGEKSRRVIGEKILADLVHTTDESRAMEMLALAWKWQVPQLDEMLGKYGYQNFKLHRHE